MLLDKIEKYALVSHEETNHLYDGQPYSFHLKMVVEVAKRFLYLIPEDKWYIVLAACWCHDLIEDARQTYNDVKAATNEEIAEIVFALTNLRGKSRKDRANHIYYKGIRETEFAVFCKLCDRIANIEYSLSKGSDMAKMYKKETPKFISYLYDEKYEDMFKYLRKIVGMPENAPVDPLIDETAYVYVVSNNEGWDNIVGVYTNLESIWNDFDYIDGIKNLDYSKFPMEIDDNATGITIFKKEMN